MRLHGIPMPTIDSRPAAVRVGARGRGPGVPAPPGRWSGIGLFAATAAGAGVTVLVASAPSLRFGPQRPALHVQIATTAALVALLVSLLAAGRYRRQPLAGDLLLALSFAVLGVSNLLTSGIQGATGESPHGPLAWMPVSGRLVAAALLAGAALGSAWAPARPRHAARVLAVASIAAVALLALALAALDRQLPLPVDASAPAANSPYGPLAGSPASIVLKGTCLGLIAVAAVGFAVRGLRRGDRLAVLLSWGTALLAFSWLNYLLVPSLYVNWFYAGDVLALAAYLLLAAGAVAEIRDSQRDRARIAALQERGRVARELHDGVAQEVLHLLAQARRLQAQRPGPEADRLLAAAERALAESRSAISTLRAPLDEPLAATLERIANELGRRLELDVRVDADGDVDVAPEVRDALARIVGEALANAARHGQARSATIVLCAGRSRRLLVRDDGCGFDLDPASVPDGAFGLQAMRERAAALGGRLAIRSTPGRGTEVEVTLP
ncbi:MAG TPA: ATP-binding protein [Conexibacter sp.]|jgi:signal transduction histidine kinase|nr:ATP-binding protein [Conexibacter sp.]